ncbi:hypothetical protein [Variovorax boronicumulans]|uniref:hypothetical protein n=1 Tax=Variovorax boronicumulans TaxID=436515 RepID=UPI0012FDACA1|nr:hypothetical protein [Variovorax boronicumulans]
MAISASIIKNPLTIIGVFASLVEVMGLGVLPLIDKDIQQIYVWFLMLFPTALVAAFFIVLYTKHIVLYAPSDYQSDNTFADIHKRFSGATTDQILAKQAQESIEAGLSPAPPEVEKRTEPDNQPKTPETPHGPDHNEIAEAFGSSGTWPFDEPFDFEDKSPKSIADQIPVDLIPTLAEKWALDSLGERMKLALVRDASFKVKGKELLFDAASVSQDRVTVVEVKIARNEIDYSSIERIFQKTRDLYETLSTDQQKNFSLVIGVVLMEKKDDSFRNYFLHNIRIYQINYPFRAEVNFWNWKRLAEKNLHSSASKINVN